MFMMMDLKTFMEFQIKNEATGQEYVFTFQTFQNLRDDLKKFKYKILTQSLWRSQKLKNQFISKIQRLF